MGLDKSRGKSYSRYVYVDSINSVVVIQISTCTHAPFAIYTHPVASQPVFLYLICAGTFLMASSVFTLGIEDDIASVEFTSITCMANYWLYTIGFTTVISAMFSKMWMLGQVSIVRACKVFGVWRHSWKILTHYPSQFRKNLGVSKTSQRATDSNHKATYSPSILFHLWTGLSCSLDMDNILSTIMGPSAHH